jgi:hypothetical protein
MSIWQGIPKTTEKSKRSQYLEKSITERFYTHFVKGNKDDCWIWNGSLHNGYGIFVYNYVRIYAYRYSYTLKYGAFPENMLACHACNNRRCVNPDHIYPGTPAENQQDQSFRPHANPHRLKTYKVKRITI